MCKSVRRIICMLHCELHAHGTNQRTQHSSAYDTSGHAGCYRPTNVVTEVPNGMSVVVVGGIVAVVPQPATGAIVAPAAAVVADTSFPTGDIATVGNVVIVVEVCQRTAVVIYGVEVAVVPEPAVVAEVAPAAIVVAYTTFPSVNEAPVIYTRTASVMASHLMSATEMTVHFMSATVHLMTATVHLMTATIHLMSATVHVMTATVHVVTATIHLMTIRTSHAESAVAVHNHFPAGTTDGSRASAATLSKTIVYHGHHDDHHQHLE